LYELPEDLNLPRESVCYITDLSMPYAFHSVDANNHNLYLYEHSSANPAMGPSGHARRISLTQQHYDVITLESELQTRLNQANDAPGVPGKLVPGTYTVTYDSGRNSFNIALSSGNTFKFITDKVLLTDQVNWVGASGPTLTLPFNSVANMLGLRDTYAFASSHETGHLDVRGTHTLYLHSSTLGSYNTIGPLGVKSVLLRIPVVVGFGQIIRQHHSGLVHDYIDCGGQTLRTIQFSLRDGFNRTVDLHGGNLSFTLLFTEKPVI